VVGLGCVRADGPAPATFWLTDRHAGQNGLVSPVVHARWGELVRHGPLWKLTRSGLNLAAAPVIGQHTDAILEELGYDAATIARLHAERVVEREAVEARAGA
jgi:crotonobetainyl-CoA:carnitine CoA-transferase CaiB-like acyl-CoA transferase